MTGQGTGQTPVEALVNEEAVSGQKAEDRRQATGYAVWDSSESEIGWDSRYYSSRRATVGSGCSSGRHWPLWAEIRRDASDGVHPSTLLGAMRDVEWLQPSRVEGRL